MSQSLLFSDDKGDLLNPMDTVEKNPNIDSTAGLLIRFPSIRPHPLYYPPIEKVIFFLLNSCVILIISYHIYIHL